MTELDLFAAAVAAPDPAARAALLDRECGGNTALRERLDKLLAAHLAAHPLLDPPAGDGTRSLADTAPTADPDGTRDRPTPAEAVGELIAGRYKLLQQIGEGGMGAVWMADQTEPVRRRVAVKLIRAERGQSKTILARFEAERQAIALMDHPHIAKLLDAGTTETGAPFFVMDLVKGVPLAEYCDAHKLSLPDRLALFQQICSAVQHAHNKGVIHRDLKPSNILVESHDGKPVPKVIDFGLAKATTGLQLTEHTLFTGFGTVMGTPTYMAPEQATFNAVDVDTRADVYALGVILYELLTGTTPLTRDTIKKAALDEMLRLIREQEAPTPSSRLSSADATPSVAVNRQTEPAKLGRYVRGELDWIVMKALSKDRDRRYETANGFAADVGRFLNHEPVVAGPPSVRYRLRKFIRRHRPQVLAVSLLLLALVAGVVGTTLGLLQAEERRKEAAAAWLEEAKQRGVAEVKREEAEVEKRRAVEAEAAERTANDRARAALYAMTGQLVERQFARQFQLTAQDREYLRTVLRMHEVFAAAAGDTGEAELTRANGDYWVGRIHYKLGDVAAADAAFRRAEAAMGRLHRADPTDPGHRFGLAEARYHRALMTQETGKQSDALGLLTESAEAFAALHTAAPLNTTYLERAGIAVGDLARLQARLGKTADADASYRTSIELLEATLVRKPTDPAVGYQLALAHIGRGNVLLTTAPADAIPPLRAALEVLDATGAAKSDNPFHRLPGTEARNVLALAYRSLGRLDEAQAELERVVSVSRELVRDFPGIPSFRQDLGQTVGNLGVILKSRGRVREAEPLYRESNEIRAKLVADFPTTVEYRNDLAAGLVNLAQILMRTKPAEARTLLEQAVPHHLAALKANEKHPNYRRFYRNNLNLTALACLELKEYTAAAAAAEQLGELGLTPVDDYYAARTLGDCAIGVLKNPKVVEADREGVAKAHTDRALVWLTRAVARGWRDAEAMAKDPALAPLRQREEFKDILDAHAKPPAKPELAPQPRAEK